MGGKTGTSTSTTTIPPQVLARYNSVNSQAQGVAATPFQQYSTNPNAFVAPVNQQQYAGIGGINQAANMAQPAFGAAEAGTFNATQQATPQGFQSGVSNYMNPFLNTAVQGTVNQLQNVNQQQQQGMLGNAISQGAFGGDRANIGLGNLMNQQNLALGQTVAGMENQGFQNAAQNYQTGINQQLAGSNQLGNLGAGAQQSALAGAQAQLGAGTMEQQTQQAGNTALYNQFQQQQAYPFQVAQFLANIAEGTGALSGSSTTSTQPMPFFSDRRLKENIKKVGKANNGLPIYTYNYKNDPTEQTHIGFMADEVEKKHPDAVGLAGGYKTVDYEKAARPAKFSGGALSSEGGLVVPQHAGMGFAEGGTPTEAPAMPAGLAHLIAMQNEMPVRGGGINQDVAASAQAIAPQNFVPPEAMSAPINYFSQITDPAASPAAAPDLSTQKHTTDTTGLMPNHNNQMFNLSNDPTASYSGYGNQNSPSEYGPGPGMGLAAGGRIGKEGGGSVYDMIAQQQAIYDQLVKGIPTSRNIATGAPSQQHQLLGANQPKPQQPQSGLQQLGGVSGLIGLGKEASQGYDWAKAHMPSSSTPAAAVDSSIAAVEPAAPIADIDPSLIDKNGFQPNLARGGVAGRYADGGTAQDDMPYKDPNDLDIPNENNNYKLNQEANPQGGTGSGSSQSGLGIGQALQLANMAGSAMSGIGSALGLLALKSGGVAGRGHYADGGDPRPDAADINGPIDQSSNDEDLSHSINRLLLGNAAGPVAPAESIVKGSQTDNTGLASPNKTGMSDADLAWAAQHNKASAAPIDVKNYPVVAENGPVKGLASPVAPSNAVSTNNVKATETPAPDTSQGLGSAKSWFDDAGNRNMALSILSGLGHMAGSNSRYLGSAILQGLGGGAETYANLQKQPSEIAHMQAATAAENMTTAARQAEMIKGSVFSAAGNDWVLTADGNLMLKGNWLNLPPNQRPPVMGADAAKMAYEQKFGKQPAAANIQSTAAAPAIAEANPATASPPTAYGIGNSGMSQIDQDAHLLNVGNSAALAHPRQQSYETEQRIINSSAAAADMGGKLNQLSSELTSLPDTGFIEGGPLNNLKTNVIGNVNDIARTFGKPEWAISSDDIAKNTAANKISSLLQFAQTTGADQHSLGALQTAARVVPSSNLSKAEAVEVLSGMYTDKQKMLDQQKYLNEYKANVAKKYPGQPDLYLAQNALNAFRNDHPDTQYLQEKQKIKQMLLEKAGDIPVFNGAAEGRIPMKFIDKRYGTGMSRYLNNN